MKTFFRKYLIVLVVLSTTNVFAQLPQLVKKANATTLMVEGKPFIMMGGELHNSTGSDTAALKHVWKSLKALNVNTALAFAYWEMLEPVEGKYNFDLIDALIDGAGKENIRVVLVWFGSWKSTTSAYVPEWVKTNPKRFPRYTLADGKTLEILSPFSDENRQADAKAYAALMQHIKAVDTRHTIIMTQVENEPGCFENYRDYSSAAQKAWQSPVPSDMVSYLQANKGKLFPALEKAWAATGYKTKGTWEEVLGKSTDEGEYKQYTEELFMAYYYSRYINYVAGEGKRKLDLPAFCNGWLYNKKGFYPHATINPHVLDAYRAGGTALDFYSPNVYTIEYDELFSNYVRGGNTLFIPESLPVPAGALYAVGEFDAIGFSAFGIDGPAIKRPENATDIHILTALNETLGQMATLVTANYNSPKMRAVYVNPKRKEHVIDMGDYQIMASGSGGMDGFSIDFGKSLEQVGKHKITFAELSGNDAPPPAPASATPAPAAAPPFGGPPKPLGSALIIQTSADAFYVVGYGVKLNFALKEGIAFNHLGFLSIDEGTFENEKFIAKKRWNGDEQKASLPENQLTVLKVRLYRN